MERSSPHTIGDADKKEIVIDLSRWPFVVMRVPDILSFQNIDLHFERVKSILVPRGDYCSIMDAAQVIPGEFTAAHRKRAAEGFEKVRDDMNRHLISEAFVLTSKIARMVLTGIRWLAPPSWPAANFATLDEAMAWSKVQAEERAKKRANLN